MVQPLDVGLIQSKKGKMGESGEKETRTESREMGEIKTEGKKRTVTPTVITSIHKTLFINLKGPK